MQGPEPGLTWFYQQLLYPAPIPVRDPWGTSSALADAPKSSYQSPGIDVNGGGDEKMEDRV